MINFCWKTVHSAEEASQTCWLIWEIPIYFGQICLHRNLTYLEYGDIKNMDDILAHFATVDETVYSLLSADDINLFEERTYEINKVEGKASIFKIVIHVFTHEYHHKGQGYH